MNKDLGLTASGLALICWAGLLFYSAHFDLIGIMVCGLLAIPCFAHQVRDDPPSLPMPSVRDSLIFAASYTVTVVIGLQLIFHFYAAPWITATCDWTAGVIFIIGLLFAVVGGSLFATTGTCKDLRAAIT